MLPSSEDQILTRQESTNPGADPITVYDVLEYLASGMTTDEIVADFPELTTDHVRAALAFAAMREHRLASPA